MNILVTLMMVFAIAGGAGLCMAQTTAKSASDGDRLMIGFAPFPAASVAAGGRGESAKGVIAERDWYVWGASVIENGGKYHAFVERWPRKYGFDAWLTHQEIAHYVADSPDGPFKYVATALQGRDKGHWDQIGAYNPYICRFGGKYYLYYVSKSYPAITAEGLIELAAAGGRSPNWMPVRNAQRIGVAVADSLDGPWKRLDKPILGPGGPIKNVTVNPAVCAGPDGKFHMMLKGDDPAKAQTIQACAIADYPEGPWTYSPNAAFADACTEDACLWFDTKAQRYYAVVHILFKPLLAMIISRDGTHWEEAAQFTLTRKQAKLDDGKIFTPARMERPFMLLDADDKPSRLYVAVMADGRTYNLCLKCLPKTRE
jgi:hypothetical protein